MTTVDAPCTDGAPRDVTAPRDLASLLPDAALRWPDDVALVGDGDPLTWADLERRTRRLAGRLVAAGVAPGDRVAVARAKGPESFEAVHAVLRAGAVVVPVDAAAPPTVAAAVLTDAAAVAVLGEARTIARLDVPNLLPDVRVIIASGAGDDDRMVDWEVAANDETSVELPAVDPDDAAYFIYTSGTTGRPKGIVHTHRSGMEYACAAATVHGIGRDDRIAGMCPLHFDMSTLELYVAPLVGARIVVVGDALMRLFLTEFTELSERERITVWYGVPFFFRQLTERGALDRYDLSSLRLIMYAGEPYPPGPLAELMRLVPHAEVWNVYGPAETNAVTSHVVGAPPTDDLPVPIGRPWPTTEIRLVDLDGCDVEGPGTGELWLSSTHVMREYWRRPELTAERLTPRVDGPSWYATGDVVELDARGVLWYRGRRDHQVKVRGVRLELEAIESVLVEAPGVAYAVAGVTGGSDDASAVAVAVVARDGEALDLTEVQRWCRLRLPAAAVPESIGEWPSFPSTASGKIDRATVRSAMLDREDS
ncbi:AMP-binding protein [Ilumatobacter sp.]|uniref:AMP-binding protein n=1 Tax=Ilumatobacter sp. TaxID=1967498 RepID=UPI003AF4C058